MSDLETINLTKVGSTSSLISIRSQATRLGVDIQATTWGSAVVEAKYSVSRERDHEDDGHFHSYETAQEFSSSSPAGLVPVAGVRHIRLVVTTADADASANAPYQKWVT